MELLDFPVELLTSVLSLIEVNDVVNVSCVCKLFHEVCRQPAYWKTLCKRRWNIVEDKLQIFHDDVDWKDYYIEKHLIQKHGTKWSSITKAAIIASTFEGVSSSSLAEDQLNPRIISIPTPRETPTIAFCEEKGIIIVFGGADLRSGTPVGGVHYMDIVNKKCFEPEITGLSQSLCIERHSGICVGTKAYFFGGLIERTKTNNMYLLDIEKSTFEKLECGGEVPCARADHSWTAVGKLIYLFGGSDPSVSPLNDLHIFDTETHVWSRPAVNGTPPYPRSGHCMATYNNLVLVYGGGQWDGVHRKWNNCSNELYVLNTSEMRWTQVPVGDCRPQIDTFSAMITSSPSYFFTTSFGGRITADRNSNETYIFDTVSLSWSILVTHPMPNDCAGIYYDGKCYFFGGYFAPRTLLEILELNWKSEWINYISNKKKLTQ